VLVTIGNSLRGDDGLPKLLAEALPARIRTKICLADLGTYTGLLPDCLSGHRSAVVVDATLNGSKPGSVSIADLGQAVGQASPIMLEKSHGFSLLDELKLGGQSSNLPQRALFFGIEVCQTEWGSQISPLIQDRIPALCRRLSRLIDTLLEESISHA